MKLLVKLRSCNLIYLNSSYKSTYFIWIHKHVEDCLGTVGLYFVMCMFVVSGIAVCIGTERRGGRGSKLKKK